MSDCQSAIYTGTILHTRNYPTSHQFRYKLFMLYLDVDELPNLFQKLRFWSYNERNLGSFRRSDYIGSECVSIRDAIQKIVFDKTGKKIDGPIRMLTHLRYFGYVFNPVTFYYCYDKLERLVAVVSEIENTPWGERYTYVLLNESDKNNAEISNAFDKEFHVSPFLPPDMNYTWTFSVPSAQEQSELQIRMHARKKNAETFYAHLDMKRQKINGTSLNMMLLKFPLMTLQVIAAIYWQAFKLYLKKATFYNHPNPASQKNLFGASNASSGPIFEKEKEHVATNPDAN
jgi:DUF1365 family protein